MGSFIYLEWLTNMVHLNYLGISYPNIKQINIYFMDHHCVKCVRVRSFSGPCFPAFGLNTEIQKINILIQSRCGKIRTRKTQNTDASHGPLYSQKFQSVKNFADGKKLRFFYYYFRRIIFHGKIGHFHGKLFL